MAEDTTLVDPWSDPLQLACWVGIAAALVGTFCTWTTVDGVTLNGTQGPNDGWLVVILAGCTIGWARLMARSTWTGAIGAVGLLGAAIVIVWTAVADWIDNREALGASAGYGLLLVVAGGALLALGAVLRGRELLRSLPGRPAERG